VLKDPRGGSSTVHRAYAVPSYVTAKAGEAEAIEVLVKVLSDRLHHKLTEDNTARHATGIYFGDGRDSGLILLHAVVNSSDITEIEVAVDAVLKEISDNTVAEPDLEQAKKFLLAPFGGSRSKLAGFYGHLIAAGLTIEQVQSWPEAISRVTAADVQRVAQEHLDPLRSVTGWLLPEPVGVEPDAQLSEAV